MDAERLREMFRERGWSIHMDDRPMQSFDPFVTLASLLATPAVTETDLRATEDVPDGEWFSVDGRGPFRVTFLGDPMHPQFRIESNDGAGGPLVEYYAPDGLDALFRALTAYHSGDVPVSDVIDAADNLKEQL